MSSVLRRFVAAAAHSAPLESAGEPALLGIDRSQRAGNSRLAARRSLLEMRNRSNVTPACRQRSPQVELQSERIRFGLERRLLEMGDRLVEVSRPHQRESQAIVRLGICWVEFPPPTEFRCWVFIAIVLGPRCIRKLSPDRWSLFFSRGLGWPEVRVWEVAYA